jgi:hypothetical protein
MATTTELRKRLAALDAALASGATAIEVDGVKTSFSLSEMRTERARIESQLPEFNKRRKGTAYRVTGLGN